MVILRRIGWYLVGLSIGIVFLVFFLKKKSEETGVEFCYFPNCRVLKDIRSKQLSISENVYAEMNLLELDSAAVASILSDGKINFKKSDTKAEPCRSYLIEKEFGKKAVTISVDNCQDSAIIQSISKD